MDGAAVILGPRRRFNLDPFHFSRTEIRSTTGAWIGAALANSTHENALAAEAAANAADVFRKSRRFRAMMAASLMDNNTRCARRMTLACRVVQSVRHSPSRRMALTGIATYLVAIYLIPLGLPAFGAVVRA
jgi:hypothetical protein